MKTPRIADIAGIADIARDRKGKSFTAETRRHGVNDHEPSHKQLAKIGHSGWLKSTIVPAEFLLRHGYR